MNTDQLIARLNDCDACSADELEGCSKAELVQLQESAKGKLPAAYTDIMSAIGKNAGDFLSDVTFFYPDVLTLTEETRDLLAEEEVELPADAYVFADRDGEQILFFRLANGSGTDSPVFKWFWEEPEDFNQIFASVWDFMEEELRMHEDQ